MNSEPVSAPQLQRMTLQHLDAVYAIELKCYEFPWSRGNFIDSLAAGHAARVMSSDSGELLGYFLAMAAPQELHLLNLTVAPQAQGCGLAQRMLGALVALCREQGLAHLWLEVRQSNQRARDIYRRFGFVDVGVRRRYYPAAQGQREDAIVMQLAVDADAGTPAHPGAAAEEGSHALD